NVSVFLGDEQQSIFSFIGAKGATINYLRTHCGDKIHRLERNYRSPGYLLEMTNQYAVSNFGLDRELLPKSADESQAPEGSLRIEMAADDRGAVKRVARMAVETPHDRRVAVIVATNREADRVSEA
ncbi:MAG: ATP-dependent DNA helicase, partial [Muribaculaceae bacterium]|nr:ATP-dependent DNA helicase [Muribaculaceae bacterium]